MYERNLVSIDADNGRIKNGRKSSKLLSAMKMIIMSRIGF